MRKIILLLVLAVILFAGCTNQLGSNAQNTTSLSKSVSMGSDIQVDYTLKLENGSVIDTSFENVAKANLIFNPSRSYSPLGFKVTLDSGLIPGFVNGLIGMKEGETKTIIVSPEDGYGLYDPSKVYRISKFYKIPINYTTSVTTEVPLDAFKASNPKVIIQKDMLVQTNAGLVGIEDFDNKTVKLKYYFDVGKEFELNGIPQKVISKNDENITLEYAFEKEKEYTLNGIPQKVISKENGTISFEITLKEGSTYNTADDSGAPLSARVNMINETSIIVDTNNFLAGKTLYFEVTARKIN